MLSRQRLLLIRSLVKHDAMRFLKSRLENTILEIGFMKYDFRNQVYLVDLDRMPTAWGFEKKPPKLSEHCKKKFM